MKQQSENIDEVKATQLQTDSALQISKLYYDYRDEWTGKRNSALKNISLEVRAGECFGFLGHNGAGKTTTIKCILGLVKHISGEIKIFGADSRNHHSRIQVSYLPEQPYFYDHLTVQEIMEMYACLSGIPSNLHQTRIAASLDRLKIKDRSRSRMRALSKGLMQRVGMAQAIMNNPKLLILDEPFSGLDPIGRKEFRELLCELKRDGTTIFMSSHILSDVEFLCDRASIMVRGELRGVFDLKQLPTTLSGKFELIVEESYLARERLADGCENLSNEERFLRLTYTTREKAEEALRKAIESRIAIESYEFVHGSLEDLFVQLVEGEKQ